VSLAVTEQTGAPSAGQGPLRRSFGRRKFDKQPTQPASVLIASQGHRVPGSVIRTARGLAEGGPVAVVTIARIYGSSFGLPNPGLMPNRREMAEQVTVVERVVGALRAAGNESWGQVAASRHPAKTIAKAAQARGASHVLVVRQRQARWRTVVEGDLAKEVARKLGSAVIVEGVTP
jgi:uncharacterized caspase-like protein